MEQLIYISTARAPTLQDSDLAEILRASVDNNQRDGLTGVLIVAGRRFLQVLEGSSTALGRAYKRIKADQRHFALVELTRKPITERTFPDWAMGYRNGESEDLVDVVQALTARNPDKALVAQLMGFAEHHSRAA